MSDVGFKPQAHIRNDDDLPARLQAIVCFIQKEKKLCTLQAKAICLKTLISWKLCFKFPLDCYVNNINETR